MDHGTIFEEMCDVLISTMNDGICSEATAERITTELVFILNKDGWDTQRQMLKRYSEFGWIVRAFAHHGYLLPQPPFDTLFIRFNPIENKAEVVVNGALVIYTMDTQEFTDFIGMGQEALDLFEVRPLTGPGVAA